MNLAIWYIVITTVASSPITYPRPLGPFTLQECSKAWAALAVLGWSEVDKVECLKAARFEVCSTPDFRSSTAGCCCPILEIKRTSE